MPDLQMVIAYTAFEYLIAYILVSVVIAAACWLAYGVLAAPFWLLDWLLGKWEWRQYRKEHPERVLGPLEAEVKAWEERRR